MRSWNKETKHKKTWRTETMNNKISPISIIDQIIEANEEIKILKIQNERIRNDLNYEREFNEIIMREPRFEKQINEKLKNDLNNEKLINERMLKISRRHESIESTK